MATLLSFVRQQPHDWSNDEKAQFARIQKLLADAGVFVDIEQGLTDEGDPWCVLCSGTTGEVVIHVARIDGSYLFDSAALPRTIEGRSLDDCARRFIDDAALLARRTQHESKILLHPSTLLVSVMLTIYLHLEATGEGMAEGRTGPGLFPNPDIIEIAENGDASAAPPVERALAADEDGSFLLVLKQMLQQIVDAVQKESDRTGGQGAAPVQSWASVMLPAVVATIVAYTQDSFAGQTTDDEDASSPVGEEMAALHPLLSDDGRDILLDQGAMEETVAVETTEGPVAVDAVEAMLDTFPVFAVAQSETRGDVPEGPVLTGAMAEVPVPFAEAEVEVVASPDIVLQSPPADEAVMVEEATTVSRLVQFMSDGSIDFQDETLVLSDFITALAPDDVVSSPAPSDMPGVAILPERPDTLTFLPVEPVQKAVSSQHIADRIGAFVQVTGLLHYDTADRSNLTIYDRSIIGLLDSSDVESRSFVFEDNSTVTFVGLDHELDMIFA